MPLEVELRGTIILILMLMILCPSACLASEENDLWLLLSLSDAKLDGAKISDDLKADLSRINKDALAGSP